MVRAKEAERDAVAAAEADAKAMAAAGAQPRNCDYETAPIGNKLCHYELKKTWLDTYEWKRMEER